MDEFKEALEHGEDVKFRGPEFARIEQGGVFRIEDNGEILEELSTFADIDRFWGWYVSLPAL